MSKNNNLNKDKYNAELISDLFLSAKGPHRTAVEFCKECDISTPTFSRYLNGHNKRPCPIEMLRKIAEHADSNSKVTYEQLIAANGGHEAYDYGSKIELTKNEVIGIITTTLLFNKFECQYPDDISPINIMGLTYCPDWSINTNAIDENSKKRWDFIIWKEFSEEISEVERFVRQLLMVIAIVQLNYISFDKLTFVFSNKKLYEKICEKTTDLKLNFRVSFLLIDPASKIIKEEYFVSGTQKNKPLRLFSTDNNFSQNENSLLSVDKNNIM